MVFRVEISQFLRQCSVCVSVTAIVFGAVSPAVLASTNPPVERSQLADRARRPLFSSVKVVDLSQDNLELAEQLEVMPMIRQLYDSSNTLTQSQRAFLREKVLETILESYFDAVTVQAEAEREQGRLEARRQTLSAKRDRAVEVNNATNFFASGTLNTVGSILGFSAKTPPFPGNLNQMLSGVVASGMSLYSLRQASGGKTPGEGVPTVLAELFGRPSDEQTEYPESVWRFFHGRAPGSATLTRVQMLEEKWIRKKELEPHGSAREQQKIDLVCGVATERKVMSIDDITDQINMITDVSTVAGLMTHHLRDLMRLVDTDVLHLDP